MNTIMTKKRHTKRLLPVASGSRKLMLCSLLALYGLSAAGASREFKDSVRIHFRQSKFEFDTLYNGNRDSINFFRRSLATLKEENPYAAVRKVIVYGGASPEGSIAINKNLSEKRAKRIFTLFSNLPELKPDLTEFIFLGRDWKGLRRMVAADGATPYQEEALTLIDRIIERNRNGENDGAGNLKELKALQKGKPYAYMLKNFFPYLRTAQVMLEYEVIEHIPDSLMPPPSYANEIVSVPPMLQAPDYIYHEPEMEKECEPFYMNLHTNMLYDLAAVPNIGAEFYLGKNWSIGANWMYAWWSKDSSHRYWRIYGGDLNVRKWFGSKANAKPLTGHHLGILAQAQTWDFEFGNKGWMGGKPGKNIFARANYGASIEYGFSLPVAERLNIDFSIAAGYIGGKYVTYDVQGPSYVWTATKQFNWFGPTKAEISLVWQIGCGNRNL